MESGSITHWIAQVKEGGTSLAEQQLWDRYYSRLAVLARRQLADLPPQIRDDEDLALSALNSFFLRAERGRFPQLHDRTDLWQLLAKITVRKTMAHRRYRRAKSRGSGRTRLASAVRVNLEHHPDGQPPPDLLAALNEEYQRLMNALDEGLRPVARLKLEGYSNREIATSLGRVERTVERKLDCIRQIWLKDIDRS